MSYLAFADADDWIRDEEVSVRLGNCLRAQKIRVWSVLAAMSDVDLLRIRNFGRKTLREVRAKLAARAARPSPPTLDAAPSLQDVVLRVVGRPLGEADLAVLLRTSATLREALREAAAQLLA